MNAIKVENLVKDFGPIAAVNGIKFEVPPGEILGLLGPNGAGKTTTIRMLTGQLRPTSGKAWVAGCDILEEREALKSKIGVVFEFQNLYERLSAKDNLIFMARIYGVTQREVNQILDQVGLTGRAGDRIKTFSNGMKQRLMIARALLHKPEILFLDEPTRGLDPHIALEIRDLVTSLSLNGTTILITTHDMQEADRLCQRVGLMDQGKIAALDTPAALKAQYGPTLENAFIKLTGRHLAKGGSS